MNEMVLNAVELQLTSIKLKKKLYYYRSAWNHILVLKVLKVHINIFKLEVSVQTSQQGFNLKNFLFFFECHVNKIFFYSHL